MFFKNIKIVFEKHPQMSKAMRPGAADGLLLLTCQIFWQRSKHANKVLVL